MLRNQPSLRLRSIQSTAFGRMLSAGLIALALSLAQQHAVLHWLSHALVQSADAGKAAAPGGAQHCADCDAVASFGASAPPPTGFALALSPAVHGHGAARDTLVPRAAPIPAYRSRAPPFLV